MKKWNLIILGLVAATIAVAATASPHRQALDSSGGCAIAGPANAPVTIQEFADFHCKYCGMGAQTMKEVLKNYPDKVRLVLRPVVLNPAHTSGSSGAMNAAKAFNAICLQNPSLAGAFQSELFANREQLIEQGDSFLYATALRVGADLNQMKTDMDGGQVAKLVEGDADLAESHGFQGTPSYLIGSKSLVGARPYAALKKIIDQQLRK